MKWIDALRGRNIKLSPQQTSRLESWRNLVTPPVGGKLAETRVVVVDVETTGLNLAKDRLIAIGAVAVVNGRIDLEDSFEMVLQQTSSSSKQNILIHGISGDTQIEGQEPAEVLLSFLEYLQKDPLVAFHVTFDETMLCRAIRQHLGFTFKHDWLDLAYVAPGLYPELGNHFRALDDWLNHFHIQNYARHNALADAVSTAQLLMVLSRIAQQKQIVDFANLRSLEKTRRWLEH